MQTFFNPTTPFFDGEGRPLVGAMVSFLDLETSASLIDITDSDGVPLPNPLYTGDDGRLRLENGNGPVVPCIADGLSYKVTVARRTGVEPVYIGEILQNASELFEEPDMVFVVTAMGGAGSVPNTTVLDSIAGVRLADKGLGSVVCTGYYSAGDCPSRTFTWVNSQNPPADNAVNILRNPEDATGYWKMCDPDGGLWDIRVAGCSTSKTAAENDQCLNRLLNIVNGYAGNSSIATAYFPEGNWLLDSGFVCGSICLEKGANLKPADNTADRTVVVDHLENRGGYFYAYGNAAADKRVVVVTKSVLRSSWFNGTLNEFLTQSAIASPEEIVFDAIDRLGSANVSISKKVVRLYDGVDVGNNIKWSDCFVLNYGYGSLRATSYSITNVNAGVTLDLAGLRMGDSASNVEVNHAGMVAKNAEETFTSTLDYAHLEFTGTQAASEFTHAHIRFGATGNYLAELGATGFTVSKGTDASEGSVTVGHDGIDSSAPLNIKKGATTPWYKKNVAASEISSGVFELGNDPFSESDRVFVNAQFDSDNARGYAVKITATPTEGRVVRIYCNCNEPYDTVYASTYLVAVMNTYNLLLTTLFSGGSITLRAKNNGWVLDPWSV